jgi:DNA-binding transcriptional LysR family regulator
MELQYIRYFLAICEQRSFVRAARQCGVSQPSLSGAIKRFERELGGPLFRRAERPLSETLPTDLALAIKAHLESALKQVEEAEQVARRARQAALQHANDQKAADRLRIPSEELSPNVGDPRHQAAAV